MPWSADPVRHAWHRFNASQWAGFAAEGGEWYTRWQHIYRLRDPTSRRRTPPTPYYEPTGLNSGIFLFNVTRWRRSAFDTAHVRAAHAADFYKRLGDQDILNAYFHSRREEVAVLPCRWNRRVDSECNGPRYVDDGIYHGSRKRLLVYNFSAPPEQTDVFHTLGRLEGYAPLHEPQGWGTSRERGNKA